VCARSLCACLVPHNHGIHLLQLESAQCALSERAAQQCYAGRCACKSVHRLHAGLAKSDRPVAHLLQSAMAHGMRFGLAGAAPIGTRISLPSQLPASPQRAPAPMKQPASPATRLPATLSAMDRAPPLDNPTRRLDIATKAADNTVTPGQAGNDCNQAWLRNGTPNTFTSRRPTPGDCPRTTSPLHGGSACPHLFGSPPSCQQHVQPSIPQLGALPAPPQHGRGRQSGHTLPALHICNKSGTEAKPSSCATASTSCAAADVKSEKPQSTAPAKAAFKASAAHAAPAATSVQPATKLRVKAKRSVPHATTRSASHPTSDSMPPAASTAQPESSGSFSQAKPAPKAQHPNVAAGAVLNSEAVNLTAAASTAPMPLPPGTATDEQPQDAAASATNAPQKGQKGSSSSAVQGTPHPDRPRGRLPSMQALTAAAATRRAAAAATISALARQHLQALGGEVEAALEQAHAGGDGCFGISAAAWGLLPLALRFAFRGLPPKSRVRHLLSWCPPCSKVYVLLCSCAVNLSCQVHASWHCECHSSMHHTPSDLRTRRLRVAICRAMLDTGLAALEANLSVKQIGRWCMLQ
jgi:hypothetical protein